MKEYTRDEYHRAMELGDLMDLEEFKDDCKAGGFIDDDGHGDLVNIKEEKIIQKSVDPSDIVYGNHEDGASHIIWYNK